MLVRATVQDDPTQARAATKALAGATLIAIPLPCLAEFYWVLRQVYGLGPADIAAAIRALMQAGNVAMNRQAVECGLLQLEAGGDFVDGLIAYEGRWLGGETFMSFDRKAVSVLTAQGHDARSP